MFKLYRKSQEVQYNWIRNHPVQYVALNAILIAGVIGYIAYKERQETRKLENAPVSNQEILDRR
jgi:hypothetical protein